MSSRDRADKNVIYREQQGTRVPVFSARGATSLATGLRPLYRKKMAFWSAGPKCGNCDKQTKAINFPALGPTNQLKNLESKVTTSIIRRDMASFDSSILS